MRPSRLSLVSVLVVAGLFTGAGTTVRAPAGSAALGGAVMWRPPTTVFSANAEEPAVGAPAVVLDRRGDATVVWNVGSAPGREVAVMEADWTQRGGWSAPRTLRTLSGSIGATPPRLAVNARGDAVVVWTEREAGLSRVYATYRPAGGLWRRPRTVSPPGVQAELPRVALDGSGRALVLWRGFRDAAESSVVGLEVATGVRSGSWSTPTILCACRVTLDFDVAMNSSGHALVVWTPERGGLWLAARSPKGRWSTRRKISPLEGYFMTKLTLNAAGAAVVSWVAANSLEVAVHPVHGGFGPTQGVADFPYWGFALALAATGEAVVMSADECCLYALARRPGTRLFTLRQVIAQGPGEGGANVLPAIGFDRRGDALALWTRSDATSGRLYVHAAQRPAGGGFDNGSDVGEIGGDCYKHLCCSGAPAIAVGANGSGVAVWLARPNLLAPTCTTVEAATFRR
jgi:hypothetical protein